MGIVIGTKRRTVQRTVLLLIVNFLALISTAQITPDTSQSVIGNPPADSMQDILSFYDSLSPDSNFLGVLQDSSQADSGIEVILEPVAVPIVDERNEGNIRLGGQKLWMFGLFILVVLLIGITRFVNPGIHDHLLSEVFKLKRQDFEDEPRGDVRSTIIILQFLVQTLIFAVGIYAFINYDIAFTFDASILDYLFILTLLIVALLLKYFAYKFTGDVLSMPRFSSTTIGFIAPLGYTLSLFLLPVLALKYYNTTEWIQIAANWYIWGLLILYFLFRSLKLIITSYRYFSFFKIYLFIYLCAVEILPVVILFYLLGNFGIEVPYN